MNDFLKRRFIATIKYGTRHATEITVWDCHKNHLAMHQVDVYIHVIVYNQHLSRRMYVLLFIVYITCQISAHDSGEQPVAIPGF